MISRNPAKAMQAAVYAALSSSPDLIALLGARASLQFVYDSGGVPANPATGEITADFPYITIGEDHLVGQTNQASDLREVYVKVECWSRATDYGEVKDMADAAEIALDQNLTLAGHDVHTRELQQTRYLREPDGLTRRAIVTMLYRTTSRPRVYLG